MARLKWNELSPNLYEDMVACLLSLIHPENKASIRVAEKLGQVVEGTSDFFEEQVLVYGIHREP